MRRRRRTEEEDGGKVNIFKHSVQSLRGLAGREGRKEEGSTTRA